MSWSPVMPPEVLASIEGNEVPRCRERSAGGSHYRSAGDDVGWRFDVPGVVVVDVWTPYHLITRTILDLIERNPSAAPDGLALWLSTRRGGDVE